VADVRPFRGLRYNLARIGGDLSRVISPPYDVISPEEQLFYYHRSPYNIIRLEHGKELPDDSPGGNKYSRAAATLRQWLQEGVLLRDERPSFYLIEHRFQHQDSLRSRWGLMARVRLEEFSSGRIRPHEATMREPAQDRLLLLKECRTNLSPVMGIYRHGVDLPSLLPKVVQSAPGMTAVNSYGVAYNTWVVSDEEALGRLSDFFADRVLYIADGHHRYETALTYAKEQRICHVPCTGDEPYNFIMMALMDSTDPGLVMLPAHRLVRGLDPDLLARMQKELARYFDTVKTLPPLATLSETMKSWLDALKELGQRGTAFGMYGRHGEQLCLLMAKDRELLRQQMPPEQPLPWKDMDVTVLHWVIIRPMLGIDSREKEKVHLDYTRDGLEAVARVNAGESQLAFFLNPAPVSSVLAAADAGARLPQKSTYFYPKTPTGLVMNPLDDDLSMPD